LGFGLPSHADSQRKYYAANRDRVNAKRLATYHANRDTELVKRKARALDKQIK
jgi:hypothetical protein